jgi:anti-sigma factor RsiW
MDAQPVVCRELVELVTEYLDGELPPDLRAAVVRHLDDCDGCMEHLRLMLRVVAELRHSPPPDPALAARIRQDLLDAFRDRR